MGLTRFTIYKYCRTTNGWRYCRAAYTGSGKIKPDVVMVAGKEQAHKEGAYYLNLDGQWEKVGDSAALAQEEQAKRLARQRYEKETGEKVPEPEKNCELLRDAIDAYIGELELKVANRSRRPKTLAASRLALNEFADQSGVKLLHGVTAKVMATHMAWVVENSPTKSARTAANKFLLILQFLKQAGAVPMVGTGKSARPLGMKDAPRYTESEVETYTDDELRRFFAACGPREEAVFQTFLRAGLREQELSTLRRIDCKLDQPAPCLKVVERPVYEFVPKAYQVRDVTIDPALAATLWTWLASHSDPLAFPNSRTEDEPGRGSRVDGHLLRLCKAVAKRAGMDPDRFWLHKFRANFATACLRAHMDLESLRRQMGHRDVESLRRYITAMAKEECAEKMAQVDFGAGAATCKATAAHTI